MSSLNPLGVVDPFTIIFSLAFLFLAFYVIGGFVNRWRVSTLCSAVMSYLSRAGSRAQSRMAGSTACIVSGENLHGLVEYSVLVGVLSISNPITWLTSRLAGRADLAILRGKLARQPSFELTLVRKNTPAQRHARGWGGKVGDTDDFLVVTAEGEPDQTRVKDLLGRIRSAHDILLLSLSNTLPHIQVYVAMPQRGAKVGEAFNAIRSVVAGLERL